MLSSQLQVDDLQENVSRWITLEADGEEPAAGNTELQIVLRAPQFASHGSQLEKSLKFQMHCGKPTETTFSSQETTIISMLSGKGAGLQAASSANHRAGMW